MNLTYNPKSGHIKRDGAVIGRVVQGKAGVWTAAIHVGNGAEFSDAERSDLLRQVREYVESLMGPEKPLPPPKAKRKVAARKKG